MIVSEGSRNTTPTPAARGLANLVANGEDRLQGRFANRPEGLAGRPAAGVVSLVLSALLVACGGGGSGDGDSGNVGGGGSDASAPPTTTGTAPEDQGLIIGEGGGREASALSDEELRRRASQGTARGTGIALPNLPLMADVNMPFVIDPDTASDTALTEMAGTANQTFADHLLGIDDPDAVVTRSGDRITIDPDDAALCEDDYGLGTADDDAGVVGSTLSPDDGEVSDCLRIMADITVELDAASEESGVVTVLFAGVPVLAQGYSPNGARSELYLAGVQNVLEREAAHRVAQGQTSIADFPTLRGTLRLDARLTNETLGEEVAEVELSVTETLGIGDGETEAVTLEPSRVFMIGNDAATGETRLSVAWGALRLAQESVDGNGNRSTEVIDLGGLSFDLSGAEGASSVSLRNVGIGDVPLNVTVNEGNALSLALETFGMTIDTETETITVDSAAGIDLMIDNLNGLLDDRALDYVATFVARAPAGTRLQNRREGVTEISAGGPLTASLVEADGAGGTQREISATVGSCLSGGLVDDDDSSAPLGASGTSSFVVEEEEDSLFSGLLPDVIECP